MEPNIHNFKALTAKAAKNKTLRATLRRGESHFRAGRDRGLGELPELDTRKSRARAVRLRTLANMPELLEKLEANVIEAGGMVHWAADAAQAREIIAEIGRKNGVSKVVKGKSMVTEEIGLNPALEAAGLEVVETDLGEYIVQLAEEPPSHIIAPALHKSREEVAELFEKELGHSATEIEELTRIARDVLRDKFLNADMGVTGANMAVASTGSVVLVENEGNIRMSTTCPRVHVAVMTLEKVVDTPDDMADVLQLLPRSATGQRLSTYTNCITGPRRRDEADGAGQFHLVILDNGRSRIMNDPDLRETLACIRCGACLSYCPVYGTVGGHAYGWVYSGPIGALLGPQLTSLEEAADLPMACTGCGACAEACPVGINHPEMLMTMRRRLARKNPTATALSTAMAHPAMWRAGAGLARLLDADLSKLSRAPGMGRLARFAARRNLPRLRTPFSKRWPALREELKKERHS